MGGFPVDRLVVDAGHGAAAHDLLALRLAGRAEARGGGPDQGLLNHARNALQVQKRCQGFAHAQLRDHPLGVEVRVRPEGLGRRAHRLGVARRISAQRVLDPVAELAQHLVGQVERVLRYEEHPHALGADQADHLRDPVHQRLGRIVEQQVRLVEEEHQLGLVRVADLRQVLEKLGQEPEQDRAIDLWRFDQRVGRQDVDEAAPLIGGPHEVRQLQRGLPEEVIGALRFQG